MCSVCDAALCPGSSYLLVRSHSALEGLNGGDENRYPSHRRVSMGAVCVPVVVL